MKLSFYGAAHEVTGSCHFLEAAGKNILIDCGMQQGQDEKNMQEFPIAPNMVDYVLITHAHIDHTGRLPLLSKLGFCGEVYATAATADLCSIMLRDSAHIQEFEAEWRNRKGKRSGAPLKEPLYTMQDAETICPMRVRRDRRDMRRAADSVYGHGPSAWLRLYRSVCNRKREGDKACVFGRHRQCKPAAD